MMRHHDLDSIMIDGLLFWEAFCDKRSSETMSQTVEQTKSSVCCNTRRGVLAHLQHGILMHGDAQPGYIRQIIINDSVFELSSFFCYFSFFNYKSHSNHIVSGMVSPAR